MKVAAGFIGLIWAVFVLDMVIPIDFSQFGLVPRSTWGLFGIVTSPFLHANFGHIASNSIPLLVLITLLVGSARNSSDAMLGIILVGGLLLWTFGRPGNHIGASGLVFGLIVFLIVSGFTDGSVPAIIASAVVALLYSGTLLWGVLPTQPGVSWDGHLAGAMAGAAVAFGARTTESESDEDPDP